MNKYLYKYISFASFVNMVQTQTLNFVLPTVWEDTYENEFLNQYRKQYMSNEIMPILAQNLIFAQCWTLLKESDAMWRIYNYEKQALRIKIYYDSIQKLEDVCALKVNYNDKLIDFSKSELNQLEIMKKLIAQKRKAFAHEKEVRLIFVEKHYENEILSAIQTLKYISMVYKKEYDNLENFSEQKIIEDVNNFNLNERRKSHAISFAHINNFIKGVLVSPFASSWYVDTVKQYCELNNIPFEGQSELYKEINNE